MEFDPDQAGDRAMCLFWRQGYESTSLQDLLEAMEISKSSFYQTFKSKRELYQHCIRLYGEQVAGTMKDELASSPSGMAFISASLHDIANSTVGPQARHGCFLMNTASEFAQRDPVVSELVAQSLGAFTDLFEDAVRRAQKQNAIAPDKDARTLASYLVSSMGGLRNMVKAGADAETVRRIADVTLSALT